MKRFAFMTVVMLLTAGTVMTLASCTEIRDVKTALVGDESDSIVTQNRKAGKFVAIRIDGSPTVVFEQGSETKVSVEGGKRYVDNIETALDDGVLVVRHRGNSFNIFGNIRKKVNPVVHVMSPDLVAVKLSGSGDFVCEGPLDTDRLHITLAGSGDVDFKGAVICDTMNVVLRGSGDVDVKNVETLSSYIQLFGSGDIEVKQKNVNTTYIGLVGSGDIKVDMDNCRDVDCNLAGSGDVTLKGTVKGSLNKAKAGSGDYHLYLKP